MLASPNNPTGAVVDSSFLLELAAATPQAALLVDEAYYHFHGESVLICNRHCAKSICGSNIF